MVCTIAIAAVHSLDTLCAYSGSAARNRLQARSSSPSVGGTAFFSYPLQWRSQPAHHDHDDGCSAGTDPARTTAGAGRRRHVRSGHGRRTYGAPSAVSTDGCAVARRPITSSRTGETRRCSGTRPTGRACAIRATAGRRSAMPVRAKQDGTVRDKHPDVTIPPARTPRLRVSSAYLRTTRPQSDRCPTTHTEIPDEHKWRDRSGDRVWANARLSQPRSR